MVCVHTQVWWHGATKLHRSAAEVWPLTNWTSVNAMHQCAYTHLLELLGAEPGVCWLLGGCRRGQLLLDLLSDILWLAILPAWGEAEERGQHQHAHHARQTKLLPLTRSIPAAVIAADLKRRSTELRA